MKITETRIRKLHGVMEHEDPFWEERLVRPIDIYPEHRDRNNDMDRIGNGRYSMTSNFLEIGTDDGITGLSGPFSLLEAFIIQTQLSPILVGQDPLAIEKLWDQMYRHSIHGRKGETMMAISVVDCALWDLKGKAFNRPVYSLLGGPTRETIQAYASCLQFSVEPQRAHSRIKDIVGQGYKATKWFFRYGPGSGKDGMQANVDLVEALRDGAGENVDIMMDAWSSWDVPYTLNVANKIEKYDLKWIEEPVLADKIDSYVELQRNSPISISGGEHEYTRWGFRQIVEKKAMDYLQPDIYWAGGISELVKICALASTFDMPVIPHGHSAQATAHLIASQTPSVCPIQEHLIKWNQVHQFFLEDPLVPINGEIEVSRLNNPGMGIKIDAGKIDSEQILSW